MNPDVHTAQVLPPRALLFLGIVALHALLAYFLANGLIQATVKILTPPPMTVDVVPEKERPLEKQPVVEPRLDQPRVLTVPPPDIDDIVPPSDPLPMTVDARPDPLPFTPARPLPVEEPPLHLVGRNVMPNTEDYYPAHEKRLGVEGAAVVRACVDERGRLNGTPTVEDSSGRSSFDSAAIRIAKDGRYARAMRGDTPVPNCYRFRVNFSMSNR